MSRLLFKSLDYVIRRKYNYLGFLSRAGQSDRRIDSITKNTLARRCRSAWALARLMRMFSVDVSGSWLNSVGTGPAAASPSKMSPWRGQAASRIVGTLSLESRINNKLIGF